MREPREGTRRLVRLYTQYFHGCAAFSAMMLCIAASVDFSPPEFARRTCAPQLSAREGRIAEVESDLNTVRDRIRHFEVALAEPAQRDFVEARAAIAAEVAYRDGLEQRAGALQPKRNSMGIALLYAGIFMLTAVAGFVLRKWISGSEQPWQPSHLEPALMGVPPIWLGLGALLFCFEAARFAYISVMLVEKTWFTWDSFCISFWGSIFSRLASLGLTLMVAMPTAVMFKLSSAKLIPPLNLSCPGGECAVGPYVRFLHFWSMLVFFLISVGVIVWLKLAARDQTELSIAYLEPALLAASVGATLIARFIYCAIRIRSKYHDAKANTDRSIPVPPDPTIGFLGENWWKLPATAAATAGGVWGVLQELGVAGALGKILAP